MKLIVVVAVALGVAWAGAGSAVAYDVVCRDGTISHSGGRQGACSYHGGVAGPVVSGGGGGEPTPPTDVSPPSMSLTTDGATSTVVTGASVNPPSVSIFDDTVWPSAATGYPMTLDWGDGTVDTVAYGGSASAFVSVIVSLPSHVYASVGSFRPQLTLVDPAGHSTTLVLPAVTVVPALIEPPHYPRLSGKAQVGRTLTCLPGTWADPAARIQFRWLVGGHVSYGHTTSRLRLGRGVAGRAIACRVIVSNVASSVNATSGTVYVRRAPRRLVRPHGGAASAPAYADGAPS
jgi:hypothetical protein